MTGWSFQEFFLLVVIGLVILGPKRLPQVANQIGSWLGQARRMTRMMKRQLEEEINLDLNSIDVKKQLGLDESPGRPDKTADVSRPSYVHDNKASAAKKSVAATPAAVDSTAGGETGELPDDYSPAHGPDDVGTGVDDEEDYLRSREPEPVSEPERSADAGDESPAPAADGAEEKKENTA